jgi:hypothetical protein
VITVVASVQTAADTTPAPLWLYALGALCVALTAASPFLHAAYRDSRFHRRGAARLRAYRSRQETPRP